MKIKAFLITVLVFTLIFAATVEAATATIISPLWENTQDFSLNLHLENANSYASASVTGNPGTTQIEMTITVYKLVGNDQISIKQSTQTVNSMLLDLRVDFTAEENSYYKIICVVHVTNSEGITESFQKAKYGSN